VLALERRRYIAVTFLYANATSCSTQPTDRPTAAFVSHLIACVTGADDGGPEVRQSAGASCSPACRPEPYLPPLSANVALSLVGTCLFGNPGAWLAVPFLTVCTVRARSSPRKRSTLSESPVTRIVVEERLDETVVCPNDDTRKNRFGRSS
jgi:hypothetical protein